MSSLHNFCGMESCALSRPHRLLPVCLTVFAILLAVTLSLQILIAAHPGDKRRIPPLMAKAAEDERNLFQGPGIIHLHNTWFIHPSVTSAAASPAWLPVACRNQSGQRSHARFLLPPETMLVSEEIWYEPATGRYRRQFQTGVIPLFAIGFDGTSIHTFDWTQGAAIQKQKNDPSCQSTGDPAEIFGLASAFPISLSVLAKNGLLVRDRDTLEGDRNLLIARTAFTGPTADRTGYWRLTLHEAEHALRAITRIERGVELFSVYRSRVETCASFPDEWDLSDINMDAESQSQSQGFRPQRLSLSIVSIPSVVSVLSILPFVPQ